LADQHRESDSAESVACIPLLAVRVKPFVENDSTPRSMPVERQSEEDLWWYSFMPKFRRVLEPEFSVVVGMSYETTSVSIHVSQTCQPLFDKRFADAFPLVLRQDGNRSKSIPARCVIGNGHR